jgi:hypothetical protein
VASSVSEPGESAFFPRRSFFGPSVGLWAAIVGLLLAASGCHRPPSSPAASDVLATVGERTIRVSDLEAEAGRRRTAGAVVPGKDQLLEEMVTRAALVARARQLGLDREPEVQRSYENLLIARLKQLHLRPQLEQISITPEAVRQAGEAERARHPARRRLAILQYAVNQRTSDERRAQLESRLAEARERVRELPPEERGFGVLAVDHSDDQATRYQGGDRGWFDDGRTNYALPGEVLAAAGALNRIGDVSEVVRTDRGLYVIRLMERRAAGETVLSDLEPLIRQRLVAAEQKRLEQRFSDEVRAAAKVTVHPEHLRAADLERPDAATGLPTAPPPAP